MFGLFKQKKSIQVTDLIWKTERIKYDALIKQLQDNNKHILIYFFEDTKKSIVDELQTASINFSENTSSNAHILVLKSTQILQMSSAENVNIIFVEHYPLLSTEQKLKQHILEVLNIQNVTFYTSFEDELLQLFGAEKILAIMEKMGFNENEPMSHNLISSSIEKAQQKIEEKVSIDTNTRQRKDWFVMYASNIS
ncbi:MAG TPA: hypothetical protein PKK18_07400 [Chitinophagales bacterium]|nr:hypothetical protein [Chitinophagales bacterium]HNL57326.1 hypothetical protein [Chitinophagales bacterium]HNN26246.1 hypothetical protein [Chitinophagales bacterium]